MRDKIDFGFYNKMNTSIVPKWFVDSVQQNILLLYRNYYTEQFITVPPYGAFEITIKKERNLTDEFDYWVIIYNVDNTNSLYNFKLVFFDDICNECNNNAMLTDIHRTDDLSGKTIVNVALEIARWLGVRKLKLLDYATIKDMSLSFYRLLKYGETYYEQFGFLPTNIGVHYLFAAQTPEGQHAFIQQSLVNARTIKITQLHSTINKLMEFLFEEFRSGREELIKCTVNFTSSKLIVKSRIPISQIPGYIYNFSIITQGFVKYAHLITLVDLMSELFIHDITTYKIFIETFVEGNLFYFESLTHRKSVSLNISSIRLLEISRNVPWIKTFPSPLQHGEDF